MAYCRKSITYIHIFIYIYIYIQKINMTFIVPSNPPCWYSTCQKITNLRPCQLQFVDNIFFNKVGATCTFGKKRKGQKKGKTWRLVERWEPVNGTGEEAAARTFLLYDLSFLASKSCQGNVCFFRAGKAKYIPEVGRKAICSACIRRIHSAAFSKPIHSKSAFSGFSCYTSYNVWQTNRHREISSGDSTTTTVPYKQSREKPGVGTVLFWKVLPRESRHVHLSILHTWIEREINHKNNFILHPSTCWAKYLSLISRDRNGNTVIIPYRRTWKCPDKKMY